MIVSRPFTAKPTSTIALKKIFAARRQPIARFVQASAENPGAGSQRPTPSRAEVRTLTMYTLQASPEKRQAVWPGADEGFWQEQASLIEQVGRLYQTQEKIKKLEATLALPNTTLNGRFRSLLSLKTNLVDHLANMAEFFIGAAYWMEDCGVFYSEIAEDDWVDCHEGLLLERAISFANTSAQMFFTLAKNPEALRDQGGMRTWQEAVMQGQTMLTVATQSLRTCARLWSQHAKTKPYKLESLLANYVRQVNLAMPDALQDLSVQLHNFEQFVTADRGPLRARPNEQQTQAHFRKAFLALTVIVYECEAIVNGLQVPKV